MSRTFFDNFFIAFKNKKLPQLMTAVLRFYSSQTKNIALLINQVGNVNNAVKVYVASF